MISKLKDYNWRLRMERINWWRNSGHTCKDNSTVCLIDVTAIIILVSYFICLVSIAIFLSQLLFFCCSEKPSLCNCCNCWEFFFYWEGLFLCIMQEWWVELAVLVHLENSTIQAEHTTFQVRLEMDIWEERIETEMESHKWGIADKRVIALKTKETSQLFLKSLV